MGSTLGLLAFIVMLLFAIGFHEFGHFITARWAGIKVSRFFIGFGPTVWSIRRGRPETVTGDDGATATRPETEYGVKLFPIGGFVKVVGMSPFDEVPEVDRGRAFGAAPAWKRAIVLAAGSVTHVITAFLILFLMFAVIGVPNFDEPTLEVASVERELDDAPSPAVEVGIEPGDTLVAVDGESLSDWDALVAYVRDRPGQPFELTYRSDGREVTRTITPIVDEAGDETVGRIGIGARPATERINPVFAVGYAGRELGGRFVQLFSVAPEVFSPSRLGLGREPSDDRLISIVGAGRIAADLGASGQILFLLLLFVNINVFIAIFNMLPLPPLDGGHLLLLGIERARGGKPANQNAVVAVMATVFGLLMILSILLIYLDIVSPARLPGQ